MERHIQETNLIKSIHPNGSIINLRKQTIKSRITTCLIKYF